SSIFSFRWPALFICLFLIAARPAAGAEENNPTIDNINITGSSGKLLLSSAVRNCFTKEMLEGMHNGIPVTFRFKIKLEHVVSYWFDQKIAEHGINHTLSYDPIRREYQIACSERSQLRTTRSLGEAQRMMAELKGFEIVALNKLIRGEKYTMHLKATLEETTFPLSIHSLIPFISLWNLETDWRLVEFRY
ncbi:DUF4390 domain-containing protein, partial [Desulfobulbus sp. F3]|nr:DUF4390 domain-containing protein [Desulfobulbus sp. F3]